MLQKIRNSRYTKGVCFLLTTQIILSSTQGWNAAYAGDGGPTQPEVHSFEPIGTDQMVDLFTGDFTYNIPLFNLPGPDGGYPINLAYHSGAQMDQEASWVGLGWNINMGTINRQIRNLPDDFGGDQEENITIKTDMRPNWTVGAGMSKKMEIFGLDNNWVQQQTVAGTFNPGLKIYYNNYKGIGYSIDTKFNLSFTNTKYRGYTQVFGDLGLNPKLNSQEGISADVSAGVRTEGIRIESNSSISTGFSTRTGWQRDLSINTSVQKSIKNKRENRFYRETGGSNISFANPVTNMQVPHAMRGVSGSFSAGLGPNATGFFQKTYGLVFFNTSHMKYKNDTVKYKGIGYLYYQGSQDNITPENDHRVKDIGRENEGPVHKDTRRLASPTLSYDIYSVTGQGIGNMFRPVRNDIGTVVAPFVESKYYGGDLGFEKNKAGNTRIGIDIGFQYSGDKSDNWPNPNAAGYSFQDNDASLTRSVYFKNYGELSSDDLVANYGPSVATNKPVVYELNGENNFYDITNNDLNENGAAIQVQTSRAQRRKRSLGTEAFTNNMIMSGSSSLIPEFDIQYYTAASGTGYNKANLQDYDDIRDTLTKTHVGGYVATNDGGIRYVYALPAQNTKERDVVFSVKEEVSMLSSSKIPAIDHSASDINYQQKGTDKYYNSVQKESYAHSYLLTSILGMDYVDLDGTTGPSDGDLGYWVKFNYARAHSGYKWRSPYTGAIYDKGYETAFTDGKGRYSYGEKEIWYVATVETKTHIAEFIVSVRQDCKQANNELDGGAGSGAYYKLDRIDVYTKNERYPNGTFNASAKPVQSCHFEYDYSLCKKTPDNNGTDGKLTLKKVYFTYRNNQTGSTTPYEFEYNNQIGGADIEYARDAVDRWGNYQPGANASNIDYPYVSPYTAKADMDARAALWNLKAINLPSGGRYEIDYESDSYAYVQHEVAMQMFNVVSMEPYKIGGTPVSPTGTITHVKDAPDEDRKVYFKLEKPIPTTMSAGDRTKEIEKYIHANEYLYFKVKINLTKNNSAQEYVAGYAKVKEIKVDETSDVSGNYIWGYVTLDYMKVNGQNTHFHPFTEAGSRHLRYNEPQLLYDNSPNADMEHLSKSDIKNMGQSLVANATDFVDIFTDFTEHMYNHGNGRLTDINLDKSYLRMRTPDKVKFGGGHRVKEIRIIDNWAASFLSGGEASSTYGTVYEYDMTDENGATISSGVAAYEPMVGGDEIPLRNPIAGWEDKNIASKNMAQTYTEEPGNESLFPGPTVGYRQVKVLSKNTSQKKNNLSSNVVHYGGITVHEFYTAKDYPVITDVSELETDKTFRKSRLIVPALIVNVDRLRMAATQGYYIETNDMHGKPKGAREIAFNTQGVEEVVSSVKYEYFDEARLTTNRAGETFTIRSLKNDVEVLYADVDPTDPNGNSDIRTSTLATEIEFIPETRYHQSRSISTGLDFNFETFTPLALFYPVPTFNWKEEKTGTVVTNKIVNKAGIMKKVTATQRGSISETENLVFDDITGAPLLTSLTNDYGNKIYNYSIMARDQYEAAGAAYENIGFNSIATAVGSPSNGLQEITLITPSEASNFVSGDVLLATPVSWDVTLNKYVDQAGTRRICYFSDQKLSNSNLILETANALSGTYRFTVIRSGRRNTLTAGISSITALSNPTINRVVIDCEDRTGPKTQTYPIRTIDSVLAISAVELGNHWYKDSRQLPTLPGTWYDNAFYSKGFSGNFSPVRSYAYIDNRKQTAPGGVTTVNLEIDGVMDDVQLFNWDRLQAVSVTSGCPSKWKEVNQITMKNPSSFDIETRNILQTYASSIFGRSGTEPIAVAANARNTEIGVENFEEYASGNIDITQNASNNLNFYKTIQSPSTPRYVEDRFDVTGGNGTTATIAVPRANFNNYNDFVLRIHFDRYTDGISVNNEPEEILIRVSSSQLTGTTSTTVTLPSGMNVPNANERKWRGELFARRTLPNYPGSSNSGVSILQGKGHTGDQCMAISGTTESKFVQARLNLVEGEEYQFSGWFGTPDNISLLKNHSSLFASSFKVEFFDASNTLMSSETKTYTETEILQGMFIDDWQKFTLNFTMPTGAKYVSITMPGTQSAIGTAYYDDLRMQPRDGGMETYVYNQQNQRLEAQLDANNYATFYYYDDEGNLFLVKRETEKGIITVQESRTYMKKH